MDNGSSNIPISMKKTGGKRKIPIELISSNDARQVCFSKRRKGLFKKASELSVLCGAQVRIVAFSPAGNPYHHFSTSSQPTDNNEALPDLMMLTDLGRQASELFAKLEASKIRNESLKARREIENSWNMDQADLAQLMAAKKALEERLM